MSEAIRTLKDGYWDLTSIVRDEHGELRVRKESRAAVEPGPWAHAALRNEIRYLQSFTDRADVPLPPLLRSWDDATIGYEIPYYKDRLDFARALRQGDIDQSAATLMQGELCAAVYETLHRAPLIQEEDFAGHLETVVHESIHQLAENPQFSPLVHGSTVVINGQDRPTLSASAKLLERFDIRSRLNPIVLLHGDLILENILWSPLLLIDPVSVAALTSGHPLFDLVKYESYARGELYSIREELVAAGPDDAGFILQHPVTHPDLEPFRALDLCSTFRAGYESHYGTVDHQLYQLIDAYFSLVMARNTTGVHQWARIIKGCQCLAAAFKSS